MQKPFSRFAFWLTAQIMLVVGSLGFLLPAVFNMDSDLMFIAMPTTVLAFVVLAWWIAIRLVRSGIALGRAIDHKINF